MSQRKWIAALVLAAVCVPGVSAARVLQDEAKQENTKQDTTKAEPWLQEFDQVCSKTTDAMSLSIDELKSLVSRCDALEPKLRNSMRRGEKSINED